jgi:hypothetical protein
MLWCAMPLALFTFGKDFLILQKLTARSTLIPGSCCWKRAWNGDDCVFARLGFAGVDAVTGRDVEGYVGAH